VNADQTKLAAVFYDPSGRRARQLRWLAIVVAVLAALLTAGFVTSLIISPNVAGFAARHATHNVSPIAKRVHKDYVAARKALFQRFEARGAATAAPLPLGRGALAGAYFAPWEDAGLDSFRAHAGELDVIYPTWLSLASDGKSLITENWDPATNETTKKLTEIARTHAVRIVPVLSNASEGQFDAARIARMLASPETEARVSDALIHFVSTNHYDGLQLDFELIDPALAEKLALWIDRLAARFHAQGKELSLALELDLPDGAIRALSRSVDYAVAMAYDEHEEHGGPGPVASADYIDKALKRFVTLIGAEKLVLGIGNYGYDWKRGSKESDSITNAEAIALVAGYRDEEKPEDVIDFDPGALNPTFEYVDENNIAHEVWFLDATSAANAMTLARSYGVRGAALWALGMEDPSSWKVCGHAGSPTGDLHEVIFPQETQFIGDGELLRVIRRPEPGSRSYETDSKTGLVTDEIYHHYPSGWLVQRSGAPDHVLALSFDDGPDPRWTPQVLDILKRHNIKASFFMIGANVAAYPDLVQRVFAEGHEIGNHSFTHPNMMHASPERVRLELVACQRALEAVLGRSVTLFRPPFNADSEPRSYGEIMPVAVANDMGYVTAGETIDPLDWDTEHENADGSIHYLTADDIVGSVMSHLSLGHAILLHDAGGNRAATVAALDPLITKLEQKGYRFATMGELAGLGRDQTMPVISASDRPLARVDEVAFTVQRIFSEIVFWGFSTAIVLGLMRIALMISLAIRKPLAPPAAPAEKAVTVLIAAYNEEPVIERTIDSILASKDVAVQILVVDDGSVDGTADVVTRAFGKDSRVTLLRKANGGKASALNMALAQAATPIVIGVDADTQLDPDAIANLLRWFADAKVGAVAGNVKVGNRDHLVTRWQSLEYVVSQNVDRRALARLNAITVVPGAIGAWRVEALRAAGGFRSDTLAEDMDLTWRLRIAGWVIANEVDARAYTEAPSSLSGLTKQRFRWTFGTLQCLWKHRRAVFHYGWFGKLALPSLWLFQIAAQMLAPLVDLQLLLALISRVSGWIGSLSHTDITPGSDPMLWVIIGIYVAFLALELAAGYIAYALDGEDKRDLWLLPTQRVVYRQIMYWVAVRAVIRALGGLSHGWGKLKRSGSVTLRMR
jgi:cellulose synthase/poly-beta-1,6-N-acetylglucosamine synthase-like glycosyltransferase/spore germination protein YaaH/peptidoglycan/xylan/chitin deacetylase (PgdA/CDA1 family)